MTIANVLKRIARGMGTTPEKAAMDYCFAHGFTAGKNFQYNSGYPTAVIRLMRIGRG